MPALEAHQTEGGQARQRRRLVCLQDADPELLLVGQRPVVVARTVWLTCCHRPAFSCVRT
jgi:hypothetical protein